MNDDEIIEHLRDRSNVAAPADVTPAIMQAIAGGLRRERSSSSLSPMVAISTGVIGLLILFVIGPLGLWNPGASRESTLPVGSATSVATSASPEPSSAPSSPRTDGYVVLDGYVISVLENQAADALFHGANECRTQAGYSLLFPQDWFTNADVAGLPACSWFGPTEFDLSSPAVTPKETWIGLSIVDGMVGYTSMTEFFYSEQLSIDGRMGHRGEFHPIFPTIRPELRDYQYVVPLDFDRTFVAWTDNDVEDYGLAKAILDRMMGSLTFNP